MTVRELISALRKMPQDAVVSMWMDPKKSGFSDVYWVEKRCADEVHLNDKYFTPYAEEEDK